MRNKLLILPILLMILAALCACKIKSEQPTTRPSVTTVRPTTTEATQMSTVTTTENYTVVKKTETTTKVLTTKKRTYKVTPSELPFDYERELIASIVMNEAGGECYEGKCAVAQCVLNACLEENKPFSEVRWSYGYKYTRTPSEAVLRAVDDVFLNGIRVTDEPILYYYNPAYGYSSFHESQTFVMAIEHHRFFKRRGT